MDLQRISYEAGGKTFTGCLADGSGGQRAPGVLVAHEGPGLNDHAKDRARMLAALGFVAFALDLYGKEDLPMEQAKAEVQTLRADRDLFRLRVNAAFDTLKAQPHVDAGKLAAIGFCIGGMAVLELARSGADVAAVVGFHAALDTPTPQDAENIKAKVLVCLGADDPIVTAEQRAAFAKEMTDAKVDWQMHIYGGVGHSFTNREIDNWNFPGFAYNADADRRSWAAMRDFFEETLGPR